jgi:hypothetical protein
MTVLIGDNGAEFEEILEGGAVMDLAGGVDEALVVRDGLVVVVGAPLAGRAEVLETESDGIDLAVALGALWFLLVEGDSFAGGEWLSVEAGELRDVRWRGRRGVVHEFSQNPSAAFDGAGVASIASDGVDRGHAQDPSARGVGGDLNGAELISFHAGDVVEVREESVDDDVLADEHVVE